MKGVYFFSLFLQSIIHFDVWIRINHCNFKCAAGRQRKKKKPEEEKDSEFLERKANKRKHTRCNCGLIVASH